jgi:citrate synthase
MTQVETKERLASTKGLEGVSAGASELCFIDGREGRLLYRGYDIHDLATHCSFEEAAYLLWNGELPTQEQLEAQNRKLAAARPLPQPVLDWVETLSRDVLPMAALRTGVSLTALSDPDAEDMSREANVGKSVRLTGQMASLIAAIHRRKQGQAYVAPRAELSHGANFLYMLHGREPDEIEARTMDMILLLHADHGFNASTFTGRVICSTLSDIYSSVVGAIGALKGPLHGGAGVGVLDALEQIGDVEKVEGYVRDKLARKEKIMGFGHRVYKVEDPRAVHLRELAKSLSERSDEPKWYQMALEMENVVKQEKQISVNVDFYSATVQRYLGVPKSLFTCTFAASRIVGWTAHILEQYADNRLIRPRCDYVGPQKRAFVPIEQR